MVLNQIEDVTKENINKFCKKIKKKMSMDLEACYTDFKNGHLASKEHNYIFEFNVEDSELGLEPISESMLLALEEFAKEHVREVKVHSELLTHRSGFEYHQIVFPFKLERIYNNEFYDKKKD